MSETLEKIIASVPPYSWALMFLAGATMTLIGGFVWAEARRTSTDLEPEHVPRHSTEGETRELKRGVRRAESVWPEDLRP